MDEPFIKVNDQLAVSAQEIAWRFTRSSGPGGQNVNKTATRVELLFDVESSPTLDDAQRQRIRNRLGRMIDSSGVLHLTSQTTASQWRNREEVLERFRSLLAFALEPFQARVHTRTPRSERLRRRENKSRRSQKKRQRGIPPPSEW